MNDLDDRLYAAGERWRANADNQLVECERDYRRETPKMELVIAGIPPTRHRVQMAVIGAAVLVTAAGLAGLIARAPNHPVNRASPSVSSVATPSPRTPVLADATAAIARVLKLNSEIKRSDHATASLRTYAAAAQVPNFAAVLPSGPAEEAAPNAELWVVTVVGEIQPSYSGAIANLAFDWGIYFLDMTTGDVLGTMAGNGSPPVF